MSIIQNPSIPFEQTISNYQQKIEKPIEQKVEIEQSSSEKIQKKDDKNKDQKQHPDAQEGIFVENVEKQKNEPAKQLQKNQSGGNQPPSNFDSSQGRYIENEKGTEFLCDFSLHGKLQDPNLMENDRNQNGDHNTIQLSFLGQIPTKLQTSQSKIGLQQQIGQKKQFCQQNGNRVEDDYKMQDKVVNEDQNQRLISQPKQKYLNQIQGYKLVISNQYNEISRLAIEYKQQKDKIMKAKNNAEKQNKTNKIHIQSLEGRITELMHQIESLQAIRKEKESQWKMEVDQLHIQSKKKQRQYDELFQKYQTIHYDREKLHFENLKLQQEQSKNYQEIANLLDIKEKNNLQLETLRITQNRLNTTIKKMLLKEKEYVGLIDDYEGRKKQDMQTYNNMVTSFRNNLQKLVQNHNYSLQKKKSQRYERQSKGNQQLSQKQKWYHNQVEFIRKKCEESLTIQKDTFSKEIDSLNEIINEQKNTLYNLQVEKKEYEERALDLINCSQQEIRDLTEYYEQTIELHQENQRAFVQERDSLLRLITDLNEKLLLSERQHLDTKIKSFKEINQQQFVQDIMARRLQISLEEKDELKYYKSNRRDQENSPTERVSVLQAQFNEIQNQRLAQMKAFYEISLATSVKKSELEIFKLYYKMMMMESVLKLQTTVKDKIIQQLKEDFTVSHNKNIQLEQKYNLTMNVAMCSMNGLNIRIQELEQELLKKNIQVKSFATKVEKYDSNWQLLQNIIFKLGNKSGYDLSEILRVFMETDKNNVYKPLTDVMMSAYQGYCQIPCLLLLKQREIQDSSRRISNLLQEKQQMIINGTLMNQKAVIERQIKKLQVNLLENKNQRKRSMELIQKYDEQNGEEKDSSLILIIP